MLKPTTDAWKSKMIARIHRILPVAYTTKVVLWIQGAERLQRSSSVLATQIIVVTQHRMIIEETQKELFFNSTATSQIYNWFGSLLYPNEIQTGKQRHNSAKRL